jgi:hypothetical protein
LHIYSTLFGSNLIAYLSFVIISIQALFFYDFQFKFNRFKLSEKRGSLPKRGVALLKICNATKYIRGLGNVPTPLINTEIYI